MKNNGKINNILFINAGILIVILATALFFFYKANQTGTLLIETNQENLQIFIDEKNIGEMDIPKNGKEITLQKGTHSIILSKEGFWPWIKEIRVTKRRTTEINPFFASKNINGFIIYKNDPEYWNIMSLFLNKKTSIEWDKNENTPKIILDFEEEIKSTDFYKDREDVVIVAIKDGVYALEINSESTPNFQPIYKGPDPTFVKKDNSTLYIKDGDILMEVAY